MTTTSTPGTKGPFAWALPLLGDDFFSTGRLSLGDAGNCNCGEREGCRARTRKALNAKVAKEERKGR